ncbi:hypothetical protein QTN94_00810, partial [Vibrio sp. M250220]|uniref:hypothetical protein n=1 Tax=Vibrio sp. M250220 TaxID=3020894 RepID=UPI002F400202
RSPGNYSLMKSLTSSVSFIRMKITVNRTFDWGRRNPHQTKNVFGESLIVQKSLNRLIHANSGSQNAILSPVG